MKFLIFGVAVASLAGHINAAEMGKGRLLPQYNCLTWGADGKCTTCVPRTVLINGDCIAVSDQCKTWSSTTALCLTCYTGDPVQGVCSDSATNPTDPTDPTEPDDPEACTDVNIDGSCNECEYFYVLKNGKCYAVSLDCKSYD